MDFIDFELLVWTIKWQFYEFFLPFVSEKRWKKKGLLFAFIYTVDTLS